MIKRDDIVKKDHSKSYYFEIALFFILTQLLFIGR